MAMLTVNDSDCRCFNIVDLPEEIRQKILRYLSFADLKSVCGVCRQWREMGENPFLWRDLQLFATTDDSCDCLLNRAMKAVSSPRLSEIKTVHLVHISFWIHQNLFDMEEFLRLIITHECICSLTLQHITRVKDKKESGNILQNVPNNVIRRMVEKLKFLSLKCRISRLQIKQIFEVIGSGQSNLEELCLQQALLSTENKTDNIEPGLVSDCLTKLLRVSLPNCGCLFSKLQLQSLLENLQAADFPTLKHLNMGGVNFLSYPEPLFSESLTKFETVDFQRSRVSTAQLTGLFERLGLLGPTNLKHVKFGGLLDWGARLEQIPTNILVDGFLNLVSVELPDNLKVEQTIMLLAGILTKKALCLKEIKFGQTDLKDVPSPLLEDSIMKLQSVDIGSKSKKLSSSSLNITVTSEQVSGLLTNIGKRSHNLRSLKIICWEDEKLDEQLIDQADRRIQALKVMSFRKY